MRNETYPPKATFESAWASIQEMTKSVKAMVANSEKDDKKFYAKLAKSDKEHEDFNKKWEKQTIENQKIYDSIKAMQQEIGGIGKSNGEIAESYFANSFTNTMQFAGQKYDEIDRNLKRKSGRLHLQGEYDLVLYNCTSVVIIEIKYKVREKDVEQLLKKAPVFKQLYPHYAHYDLYLGMAGFHFEANTEANSIEHGIAVIKQVGDTMVINDAHLEVF